MGSVTVNGTANETEAAFDLCIATVDAGIDDLLDCVDEVLATDAPTNAPTSPPVETTDAPVAAPTAPTTGAPTSPSTPAPTESSVINSAAKLTTSSLAAGLSLVAAM